ncbi:MAG: hypothetical protein JWO26_3832 [Rhodospirillales bacterium]|jgi:hypothetical protein|nr:hypothetical protein [Rhodospirillales bacterium]
MAHEADKGGEEHHTIEEIVAKLRQVQVLVGQDEPAVEVLHTIQARDPTY